MNVRNRPRFAGDESHRLPAGMIEPYRLWFEFLKLALRDPRLTVKKSFYAGWGNVENANFDKWWSSHWRELFAIPLDVSVVDPKEFRNFDTSDRVLISIQPNAPIEQTLRQIKAIMKARGARAGRKDAKGKRHGRFALSSGAEIKRKNMQQALKVYELSLRHGGDRVKIAAAYLNWANAWNDKIRTRGWKRERVVVPPYLDRFLSLGTGAKAAGEASGRYDTLESNRRKMARLIARAHKIAANVSNGEFPGRY